MASPITDTPHQACEGRVAGPHVADVQLGLSELECGVPRRVTQHRQRHHGTASAANRMTGTAQCPRQLNGQR